MATRGRIANHLHIEVTGDGQPHPLDHDSLTDHSTIEILERILGNDEQAISATTHARQASDPARLLGPAIAKYTDALGVAAEHHLGPEAVAHLEDQADQLVLFLTSEPAWPTLKGHLVLLAAAGLDPVAVLRDAISQGSIDDARDVAALLDWRIDPTRHLPSGPLPWLHGIPAQLAADPVWGGYLPARADLVEHLAAHARTAEPATSAAWISTERRLPDALAGDLRVWRAANDIPDHDLRLTGAPATDAAATRWQRRLDRQLSDTGTPDITPWWPKLSQLGPHLVNDPQFPMLARRLRDIAGLGMDAEYILNAALHDGPLPAQGLAAALTFRLERHEYHPRGWPPAAHTDPGPRRPPPEPPRHDRRRDRGISI